MNAARFLDTNILLYAYDLDAPAKRAIALRLVDEGWQRPGETALSRVHAVESHSPSKHAETIWCRAAARRQAASLIRKAVRRQATTLHSTASLRLSVQVLQELQVSLTRHGVPQAGATQIVRELAVWPVVEQTLALLRAGINDQARWKISLWNALIVAAARAAGAAELFTEDLNHGQDYGGVRVINPFR